jgi:mannose-1-phosphate guanylyltransferase
MTNIILCGGSGTRLWPISRALMPKQFIKLFDNKSLFQLTLERNEATCDTYLIVSNAEQYFLANDQIKETNLERKSSRFLLEPIGRNTAPAIALACLALDKEEVVLVTPSDHLIKDEDSYKEVIKEATHLALNDFLVTFGIKPEFAETGFGYIEADGQDVKAFKEKPDRATAQKYLDNGNYYWNSGMFCFKAGLFLQELEKYAPKIYNTSLQAYINIDDSAMMRVAHSDMNAIPEDSIDYAVMEKSSRVKVVSSSIGWSDLGSFDALAEEYDRDKEGNTIDDQLIAMNSKDNFVYSSDRMITLADVDDLIIVDTPDALLVSRKGSSQKIKDIVQELKGRESELHHIHLTAHRPWGTYTILEESKNYKIKRIVVKPSKRLSLQKHYHRSEHWIVVSGTALVTIGDKETLVKANESTYIPMGEVHRLENPGKIDVVLIEAQVGDYLGEDDIVRLEDDYKRV